MQTYLTGTYKNGVMLTPLMEWANPNSVYNFFFGVPGSYFQVVKRPDGWKDLLIASLSTQAPDAAAARKLENAAYDDAMAIPLYYSAAKRATTHNLRDSGLGACVLTPDGNRPIHGWINKSLVIP
jgi:hypothetical protein